MAKKETTSTSKKTDKDIISEPKIDTSFGAVKTKPIGSEPQTKGKITANPTERYKNAPKELQTMRNFEYDTVTVNGETIPKAQYEAMQSVQAGHGSLGQRLDTPEMQQIAKTREQININKQAQANIAAEKQAYDIATAEENILGVGGQGRGGVAGKAGIGGGQIGEAGVLGAGGLTEGELSKYAPKTIKDEKQSISDITLPFSAQAITKNMGGVMDVVASNKQLREGMVSASQVLNKISGFLPSEFRFGGSKSAEVKAAEGAFIDADKILDLDILDVENGLADWTTVQADIEDAIEQIHILEAQTKGINLLDNRYWITDGKELEAQIKRQIKILDSKSTRLIEARNKNLAQQSRASAIANYGQ